VNFGNIFSHLFLIIFSLLQKKEINPSRLPTRIYSWNELDLFQTEYERVGRSELVLVGVWAMAILLCGFLMNAMGHPTLFFFSDSLG